MTAPCARSMRPIPAASFYSSLAGVASVSDMSAIPCWAQDWAALVDAPAGKITPRSLQRAAQACKLDLDAVEVNNMIFVAMQEGGAPKGGDGVARDVLERFVAKLK